jgi:hypothetical protein
MGPAYEDVNTLYDVSRFSYTVQNLHTVYPAHLQKASLERGGGGPQTGTRHRILSREFSTQRFFGLFSVFYIFSLVHTQPYEFYCSGVEGGAYPLYVHPLPSYQTRETSIVMFMYSIYVCIASNSPNWASTRTCDMQSQVWHSCICILQSMVFISFINFMKDAHLFVDVLGHKLFVFVFFHL